MKMKENIPVSNPYKWFPVYVSVVVKYKAVTLDTYTAVIKTSTVTLTNLKKLDIDKNMTLTLRGCT